MADKQAQIESLREQARLADRAAMAQGENVRLQTGRPEWDKGRALQDGRGAARRAAPAHPSGGRQRRENPKTRSPSGFWPKCNFTYGAQTRKSDATAEREREVAAGAGR